MATVDSCWRPVPNPRCIQWWYLFLLTDDGEAWRVRLWVQGAPGPQLRCGAELCRYPAHGEPWERQAAWGADAFHAEQDRLHVMIEACSIEEQDGEVRLAVRLPGVELTVSARSSVRWPRPVIGYDVDGTHGWCWSVPILRGRFAGRVTRGGQARDLTGTVFFDHVRADTTPSPDWLVRYRGWCWGVLWTPERSLLFLDVDFAGAPLRKAFEAVGDGPVRELSDLPVRWEGRRRPRFTLDLGDGEHPVAEQWSWPKRHRVLDRPLTERVVNAWPGLRKRHGLGRVAGGHLFTEWMRVR